MVNRSIRIQHKCFIACFVFIQVLAACSAASIGDIALCPYEIETNKDDQRIPMEIKNHNCRKSVVRNVDAGDEKASSIWSKTCEDIGGHCVQEQDIMKVTYKQHGPHHHKHDDVRYNRSCVCVATRGLPAKPVLPDITR